MIHAQIILPDGTVLEEEADEIKLLLDDGWMGVRENHSPIIAKLADGVIFFVKDQVKKGLKLTGAFFRFLNNQAVILTESAKEYKD